jgi:hypothetical protein
MSSNERIELCKEVNIGDVLNILHCEWKDTHEDIKWFRNQEDFKVEEIHMLRRFADRLGFLFKDMVQLAGLGSEIEIDEYERW